MSHWSDRPRNIWVIPLILAALAGAADLIRIRTETGMEIAQLQGRVAVLEKGCK
jgi:hypothetical protein